MDEVGRTVGRAGVGDDAGDELVEAVVGVGAAHGARDRHSLEAIGVVVAECVGPARARVGGDVTRFCLVNLMGIKFGKFTHDGLNEPLV